LPERDGDAGADDNEEFGVEQDQQVEPALRSGCRGFLLLKIVFAFVVFFTFCTM
jgi:hypothetical protein